MASMGGQPPSSLKRRDAPPVSKEGDQLIITPLGAGNEVGRSCVYMSYKGKTVLFDCGIHPAYSAFIWIMLHRYHIFWKRRHSRAEFL